MTSGEEAPPPRHPALQALQGTAHLALGKGGWHANSRDALRVLAQVHEGFASTSSPLSSSLHPPTPAPMKRSQRSLCVRRRRASMGSCGFFHVWSVNEQREARPHTLKPPVLTLRRASEEPARELCPQHCSDTVLSL